jgi:tetrahydromethanopterin S-methyltransferase subunit F
LITLATIISGAVLRFLAAATESVALVVGVLAAVVLVGVLPVLPGRIQTQNAG